ncbi:MAG: cell division protein ZapA [Alphaproteobacteria bacterium]|nr:cell division protein ZapA [Alphaproteobacteria bacterium]
MATVSFKIDGHPYKIACADGGEQHVLELAEYVNQKAKLLKGNNAFIPEGQLLAMITILLAEEVVQSRKNESGITKQLTEKIDFFSEKILMLANKIQKS